jgi:hypothetical protein
MSVGSISFWQQDQNFWAKGQQQSQTQVASAALISAMGSAVTSRTQGLASIANQTALNRTNTALTAAIQSELQQTQSGSSSPTSSSSSTSSSGSSASAPAAPTVATPAIGTGTVPLTAGTSLLTLGIPPNGVITVSDGTNTTTFASDGKDTVGDLINTINNTSNAKNAQATAYLNSSGNLVITGNNTTDPISVGGLFAQNVGFGQNNNSFAPVAPPTSTASSGTSGAASSSTSSGTSSASNSTNSSSSSASSSGTSASTAAAATSAYAGLFNSALALQSTGTAEFLLAANGSAGTTLNMLA